MNKSVFAFCLALGMFLHANLTMAQKWIPEDIHSTTVLVERYKYMDPDLTLEDVDDEYEDKKETFISKANTELADRNTKLDELFKAYKHPYVTAIPGKIDKEYPDKDTHRFILKRDVFFGKKEGLNTTSNKVEDQSYFAYRYYFYDRKTKQSFTPYYFSGDQWQQVRRVIFWLNQEQRQQSSK